MPQIRSAFRLGSVVFLLVAVGCVNRPPTLNCMAERATITEGSSVGIDTNAQDPENKPLRYDWKTTGGKLTGQMGAAIELDSSGLSPGRYTVSANVSDNKHTVSCSVDVAVQKNKMAPTIACAPAKVSVIEGKSVTLRASASDPNSDSLSYSWKVDGEDVTNDRTQFLLGTAGRSLGAHTVGVTATDVDGMTASCNFNVSIDRRPNKDPSVALSLDKTNIYAGAQLTASAQGDDPDNDPLTYAWRMDGQARSETATRIKINTTGFAGGRHSVAVTVRDDRGATASDTKSFSVREKVTIQIDGMRLNNVAKARLDEIALKMQQNPQLKAVITGHTDDRGSEKANERIGLRRAEAVKDYQVKEHNIAASRTETRSAGESQSIADNKTAAGRKENRRVEIELFVP